MRDSRHHPFLLVCDPDLQSVRALRAVLGAGGFAVTATQTAEEALTRASVRVPDVVIIEMTLLDSTGAEMCRQLRQWTSIPILIVSHVSDELQVVDALNAGADDYVTKPFRPQELIARVHAHLRRAIVHYEEPQMLGHRAHVDFATRMVRRQGQEVRLTPIEYKLLRMLASNPGRLLTHGALLRHVWGAAYAADHQVLRTHVANLRRKLGWPAETGAIRTYPGVGYLFEDRAGSSSTMRPPRDDPRIGRPRLHAA